jgi:hypothetical protein
MNDRANYIRKRSPPVANFIDSQAHEGLPGLYDGA